MRSNRINRLVTKAIVAVILLLSVVSVTEPAAQAQGRWRGHGFNRHNRVFVQPRHHRGFVRSRVFIAPQRRAFIAPRRRVFLRPRVFVGPRVGFYPRVYPSYVSPYAAYGGAAYLTDRGYRDGYSEGMDDARDGDPYNPYRHSRYRHAGSLAYRDAFLRGYEAGFRVYAG
jgi:hypothetical protein